MTEQTPVISGSNVTDGRRRRSRDSRARVVAAMLDLVREGDVSPSAERVAARAEVGLRSVFRHFKDMDSLHHEMSGVIEAELASALATPLEGTGWRARLMELVSRRGGVFENIAPLKRACDVHRRRSPFLETDHERMVSAARQSLTDLLPADVATDTELLETLDLLLSFESWSRLRQEQNLSAQRTRDVLELAVRRTIAPVEGLPD
jgi:AcrR family transcriptional regulator